MELSAVFRPLLKWWWLMLASMVVAFIASFLVTRGQPPIYQSRATLVIGRAVYESNPTTGDFWLNQQLASFYSDIAQREPIRQAVRSALGMDWLPQYNVRALPNSSLLEIVVTDTSPERAQVVANEIANTLIRQTPTNDPNQQQHQTFIDDQLGELQTNIEDTQDEINKKQAELPNIFSARQLANTQAEISALDQKLVTLRSNYAALLANSQQGAANTLTVIEAARLPTSPIGPNKSTVILLSMATALAVSAGAAFLLEFLDDTLRMPDEIARLLNLPVIGYIAEVDKGKYHGGYVAKHPRSAMAEAYRALRTDLEFTGVGKPLRTLLVTSSGVGDGKTSVSINLAVVIAQAGKRVILLDADLRKPSVHRSIGLSNRQGLSDVFRRNLNIMDAALPWKEGNISVVTSGPLPPNPTELLSSPMMEEILEALKNEADVVVIDGPPFLVTDATILSSKVDGAMLVIRHGFTRRAGALNAVRQLNRAGARVLGVVLNRIPRGRELYGGAYRYYQDYYSRETVGNFDPENGRTKIPWLFLRSNRNKIEKIEIEEEETR